MIEDFNIRILALDLFTQQVASVLLLPTALLCLGFFMYSSVNIPYTFSVAVGRPEIAS